MTNKLSGPFKIPLKQTKPEKLLVFLHGVGSDGHDLISLADEFANILPNAIFLSPNAPFPYDAYPMGYQWFSLNDRSPEKLYQGIKIALPILQNYIDENLSKYNLSYKDLILIGFSQGTMMALQLAPRLEEECFAVIGFSGALINPIELEKEKKSNPPICLIHGEEDQVVTAAQHKYSVTHLKKMNLLSEEYLIKGLAHSINSKALKFAQDFLKDRCCNE
jgi:phospholipase/carboxylesterase